MQELTAILMLCTVVGVAAGALASAMGVGASLVFIPALLLIVPLLGVQPESVPAVCVATSLTASCAATVSAVLAHLRAGNLKRTELLQARPLLLWAAAGAVLGGASIARNDSIGATLGLAIAQIVVAVILATRGQFSARLPTQSKVVHFDGAEAAQATDAQARAYVGVVGAITSIGAGGVFLAPYFLWRGLPRVKAAAMACLVGVAITPAATGVFLMGRPAGPTLATIGVVHLPLAVCLAAGSLYGARVGASITHRAHSAAWSRALAALLLLSSARAIARIV